MAIGHTRYSTTGSSKECNAQPLRLEDRNLGWLALAHNGNITNAVPLYTELASQGVTFQTTSDSEVIGELAIASHGHDWVTKFRRAMSRLTGAYSLALLTPTHLIAVRDPMGIRPLCLGKLPGGGWVVSSETCALMTVGAQFIREVAPGEIVTIGEEGVTSYAEPPADGQQALCVFEYIYFARPDSDLLRPPRQRDREHPPLPGAPEHGPRACPRAPCRG
jgi:amidophosphoribosyltransferase